MSDPTTPATYAQEAAAADELLDQTLRNIRADYDNNEITAIEAATDRISAMEQHLTTIKLLMEKYFGDASA